MIMGIIGSSLLSLSCPSPSWRGFGRHVYPTAASVRKPFSITADPARRPARTPRQLAGHAEYLGIETEPHEGITLRQRLTSQTAARTLDTTDAPERPGLPQVR